MDAIGAAEDKRGELERKRIESMNSRSIAGRGMAKRGACRVHFGTPSDVGRNPMVTIFHVWSGSYGESRRTRGSTKGKHGENERESLN